MSCIPRSLLLKCYAEGKIFYVEKTAGLAASSVPLVLGTQPQVICSKVSAKRRAEAAPW